MDNIVELNIESRTIFGLRVKGKAVENLLPTGYTSTPADAGPSKGANLLVIFTDRLLVQTPFSISNGSDSSNKLVIIAAPVQSTVTAEKGVLIIYGVSATAEGAPGPYGVFEQATKAYMERSITGNGEHSKMREIWDFEGAGGVKLLVNLSHKCGVPSRSNTFTRAYSAKDPLFYRVYDADQGALAIYSIDSATDITTERSFLAELPTLRISSEDYELISIISQPWIIRKVSSPPEVALLGLQDADPLKYNKPYQAHRNIICVNSLIATTELRLLAKDDCIWLDKELPDKASGICRAKFTDGTLNYVMESANLIRK
jgi:hypothetical protein